MRIMHVPSLYVIAAICRSPQSPVACASSLLATSANSAKPSYGQPPYGRVLRHRRTDSTVVLSYCRTHFGQIVEPVTNSWQNRILSCSDRSQAIGKRPRSRGWRWLNPVSYTHLRAHETRHDLVCRLLLEKKKKK